MRRKVYLVGDYVQFLLFWDSGIKFFTILGPNGEKVEFARYCEALFSLGRWRIWKFIWAVHKKIKPFQLRWLFVQLDERGDRSFSLYPYYRPLLFLWEDVGRAKTEIAARLEASRR